MHKLLYANRVLSTNSLGGLVFNAIRRKLVTVQWAGTGAVGRGRWYERRTYLYYDIPSVVGTTLQIDVPGTAHNVVPRQYMYQ